MLTWIKLGFISLKQAHTSDTTQIEAIDCDQPSKTLIKDVVQTEAGFFLQELQQTHAY